MGGGILVCAYTICQRIQFYSLAQFLVDYRSYKIMHTLIFFGASLLYLHLYCHIHSLFIHALPIFTLTQLVLMALFFAAINRDSVSLFVFPLLNNLQIISYAISIVCCYFFGSKWQQVSVGLHVSFEFSSLSQLSCRLYHLNFSAHFQFLLSFFFQAFIIFTNPSTRAGYDTRSIFKRNLTGMNSEFSFS